VLVVFGMPALINWFPDYDARSAWDIHGKLRIQQKAAAIWRAGYPCALLPSDFIDNGEITFDAAGRPMIHGHRFDCMIYLYPQYAKSTTLDFLDRFTRHGGKLMLEGDATHDFDGNDIATRFKEISACATVRGFDLQRIANLGVQPNPLDGGAYMEDGSAIFTDCASWQTKQAKYFSVTMSGHEFTGNFIGVCALSVDPTGNVEKFVCGGFSELLRDGEPIFSLGHPADVVITRDGSGSLHTVIVGPNNIKLTIHTK
jgi:hypothetical protein